MAVAIGPGRRSKIVPILQSASAECGLACAAMVVQSISGKQLTLQTLRSRYDVSMRGLGLGALVRLMADFGLRTRPLSIELDEIRQLRTPCIMHWRFNHYIVFEGCDGDHFWIVDPASGRRRLSRNDFDRQFTGVVLEPTELDEEVEFGAPDGGLRLSDLLPSFTRIKGPLLGVFGLTIAFNIISLVVPLFLKFLFDFVFTAGRGELLLALAASFLAIAVLQGLTVLFRGSALIDLRRRMSERLSVEVFEKLLWLSPGVVERRSAGTIATNFRSVNVLTDSLSEDLLSALIDGASGVLLVFVLVLFDVAISVAVLAVITSYVMLILLTARRRRILLAETLVAEAHEGGFFVETINRLQPIRLFQAETIRSCGFRNLHDRHQDARQRYGRFRNRVQAAGETIMAVGWVLVVALTASFALDGRLSTGDLAAITVWVSIALARSRDAIQRFSQMDVLQTHVDRVGDIVLGKSDAPHDPVSPMASERFSRIETVGCRDLSFRYGNEGEWLLEDVDLEVERGEWLAVTGRSGEGKSTLLRILLGMLEPVRGKVLFNGVPSTGGEMIYRRRKIGTVMQNDGLFGGSIRDNVTFFDLDPDIDHMRLCLSLVGLENDLLRMPMKFESLIGEQGAGLSAGQLQRVMLARALYMKPDFLFLDEFSANLDEGLEKTLLVNLRQLEIGVIAVAHRSAVIKSADRIVSLDRSRLSPIRERNLGGITREQEDHVHDTASM